jgi:small multidrug resistance family-3 protein
MSRIVGVGRVKSLLWYLLAASGEIGGCFSFWVWLRMQKSPLWVIPGIGALILFALALTRVDTSAAGRAYAAYGGVYILSSLLYSGSGSWKGHDRTGGTCSGPPSV